MSEFPITYARKSVPGQSTAAPITADVEAPGRAYAQAGEVVFQIGEKERDARDLMELSNMKRQAEESNNAAYLAMSKEQDPEKRQKIWEKARQDQNALQSKSGRVRQKYQMYLNEVQPTWDKYTMDLNQSMVKKSAKDQLDVNGLDMLEKGDVLGYQGLLKQAYESDLITQIEYEKRMESAQVDSMFAQSRILMDSNPDMAIQVLENIPDLNTEQMDQKDKLVSHALARSNANRRALRAKQDEELLDLYTRMEEGEPLSWSDFRDTSLPATGDLGSVNHWNRYKKAQEEKARFEKSQIEEGNPVVNARMQAAVDLAPEKLTDKDIYDAVDQGVGTNKVKGLVTRLRQNKKEEAVLQKYRTQLAKLQTAGVFGKLDKRATSERYLRVASRLDAFLSTNPADEQANRFFNTLIIEDVSWGTSFGPNELPGFREFPQKVMIGEGEDAREVRVQFGSVVTYKGERFQAIGKEPTEEHPEGEIQWLKLPTP